MAVLILLLIMVATLAQSYRSHRAEALALSLTLLGSSLPSGYKGCTVSGWISAVPPSCMQMGWPGNSMPGAGHWVLMRCWPLRKIAVSSGRHYWHTEPGPAAVAGHGEPRWHGCEFGWEDNWLLYQFYDGRVTLKL